MSTRWQPDTCECIIEFDGVDETTGDLINPVHIKTCNKHEGLEGEKLGKALLNHNRLKNQVVQEAIAQGADEKKVAAHYDANDNLVIHGTGFDTSKKTSTVNSITSKFPKARATVAS